MTTTGAEIERIAAEIRYSHPALSVQLARQAMDVRRMEIALNELLEQAQEDAEIGEAQVAAMNLARRSGVLVELADMRRQPPPVLVGFGG
ncbi:MAG: hypothetical protein JWQ02_4243 [Capsulimonas sp.]|nr:hypothetical protein [Capsulimonas sp.]